MNGNPGSSAGDHISARFNLSLSISSSNIRKFLGAVATSGGDEGKILSSNKTPYALRYSSLQSFKARVSSLDTQIVVNLYLKHYSRVFTSSVLNNCFVSASSKSSSNLAPNRPRCIASTSSPPSSPLRHHSLLHSRHPTKSKLLLRHSNRRILRLADLIRPLFPAHVLQTWCVHARTASC
jgi:hypothetical protein